MKKNEPVDILGQKRSATVPITTANGEIKFNFNFTRNQVAQLVVDLADDNRRFEMSRNWLLTGVDKEQRQQLVEVLNDPANFTLEIAIMGGLASFFGRESGRYWEYHRQLTHIEVYDGLIKSFNIADRPEALDDETYSLAVAQAKALEERQANAFAIALAKVFGRG